MLSVPSAPSYTADQVHRSADPSRLFPVGAVASTVLLAQAAKHNRLAASIVPAVPSATSLDAMVRTSSLSPAEAPPSSHLTPILLSRVAKEGNVKMVEVSSFSPFALPTSSSNTAGKKRRATVIYSSTDEISDSSDDDADKMDTEILTVLPATNTQMIPPIVTGDV